MLQILLISRRQEPSGTVAAMTTFEELEPFVFVALVLD